MKFNFKDTLNKAAKKTKDVAQTQFKGIRDKATEIKDSEQFNKLRDKTIDQLTTPKTKGDLARDTAFSVGLAVITGGAAAIPLALALVATESVASKALAESKMGKKIAEDNRNRKSNKPKDGPKN